MIHTVTMVLHNKCDYKCNYRTDGHPCVAGVGDRRCDTVTTLDHKKTLAWISKYRPGAAIHISGGEPLQSDNIVEIVSDCMDASPEVSLFTNGHYLGKFQELYDMPIAWHITHRPNRLPIELFRELVDPLKNRSVICRLLSRTANIPVWDEPFYDGFNFKWIRDRSGYIGFEFEDEISRNPDDYLTVVGKDGTAYHGSCYPHIVGHTYRDEHDSESVKNWRCRSAKWKNHRCQALQSALIMHDLHNELKGE